ncbi:MAG: hypothetical protein M3341_10600, partial [Actinomycetota bacterium]|nr:hypothetical protein [Actinomycetota bacterium]
MLDAARSRGAGAHTEDILGEFGHTVEQGATAGQDRASREEITEVGLLERIAHELEYFAGPVLQDLAHEVGVVVLAVEFDGGDGIDCGGEHRPVVDLQRFGFLVSDLQPVGEVGGE